MTKIRSASAALAITALGALACAPPREAEAPSDHALVAAGAQPAETLLDVRDDGAVLAGYVEPARAASDGDRVVVLAAVPGREIDARVLDARFADDGVVVLGADHVLRFVAADGRTLALDEEVHAPLSVAAGAVAYVRGAPPDLELARARVRGGMVEVLAPEMAPVWSPALSPDGTEIVFVSGIEGTPRLYHCDRDGAVHALPRSSRAPSAPTAPRWAGGELVFEDEIGVAALELGSGAIIDVAPGAHGVAAVVAAAASSAQRTNGAGAR